MSINLDTLEGNKVSVDLSQYSMIVMGKTGVGKTYSLNEFLRNLSDNNKPPLFLEFEDRYQNIPGIMAVKINSMSDLQSVISQLKNPKYKEKFSSIVIDTLDKYDELCEKYVLNNKNSEILKDAGGFGEGYDRYKSNIRKIGDLDTLGYTVHKIAQADISKDHDTKKTITSLKLKKQLKSYSTESAFLIGYMYKDSATGERYVTFTPTEEYPDLKNTFNLPDKINIKDLKDVWTQAILERGENNVTHTSTIDKTYQVDDFEKLKEKAIALAGELTDMGKYDNVIAVLKKNIGINENGDALMFDTLIDSQTDLLKVIIIELEDLKTN